MLIKRLKVKRLLSFGPEGIDLEMRGLNVLIGPNGSGKSNLLEVLSLLKAAPTNLPEPVKATGGILEWLWKDAAAKNGPQRPDSRAANGAGSNGDARRKGARIDPREASVEAVIEYPDRRGNGLVHEVRMTEQRYRFELTDESIMDDRPEKGPGRNFAYYLFRRGEPVLNIYNPHGKPRNVTRRELKRTSLKPEHSILSQIRDPEQYPQLAWLQQRYDAIRLFRNWPFGPGAGWRMPQSALNRSDFLSDGGENLVLVLNHLLPDQREEFIGALARLYEGVEGIETVTREGYVHLEVRERGNRKIPAARLSDGTLRYMCLLAILLHPEPPPLVAIEEPELGLHPDVIPYVAELLKGAAERTQLVVTTHSEVLVDALSEEPESVVVCSKENGESRFERLSAEDLEVWLKNYSLGQVWSRGGIGGNRW